MFNIDIYNRSGLLQKKICDCSDVKLLLTVSLFLEVSEITNILYVLPSIVAVPSRDLSRCQNGI